MDTLRKYWYLILAAAFLSCGAALGTLFLRQGAWMPVFEEQIPPEVEASDLANMSQEYLKWNYELRQIEDLRSKLESERKDIEEEKLELTAMRQQVSSELAEMMEVRDEINSLRDSVDEEFYSIKESEAANLKRLAKVYAGMKPVPVVQLFQSMDMELVVKIMSVINDEAAADILAEMSDPKQKPELLEQAVTITEKLRQISK